MDPDGGRDLAGYLGAFSDSTIPGDCRTTAVHPTDDVDAEARNRGAKFERFKVSLQAEMVRVEGEIVIISCEQCGNRHGILIDHVHPEILSVCSCGSCRHPLFSAEELRANQFEDC